MPRTIRKSKDKSAGHCFKPRPADQGSPDTFINHLPSVRRTDHYPVHSCGDRSHDGNASEGSPNVFVNNLAIHRFGDAIDCGDKASEGSPNVFANEPGGEVRESFQTFWKPIEGMSSHPGVIEQTYPLPTSELPDEIAYPTERQADECPEGYLSRAGNPTSEQFSNGDIVPNTIATVSIPVSAVDNSVNTRMELTQTSTVPAQDVRWRFANNQTVPGVTISQYTGVVSGILSSSQEETVYIEAFDSNGVIDTRSYLLVPEDTNNTGVQFAHPLPGSIITSPVSTNRINPVTGRARPHRGTDFAYGDRRIEDVLASADGRVVFAGGKSGYGNTIVLGHFNSNGEQIATTLYAHLHQLYVRIGDTVTQGQPIGLEGNTGVGTGAHLHFEIRGPNYIGSGSPYLNQSAAVFDAQEYINGIVFVDTQFPSDPSTPSQTYSNKSNATSLGYNRSRAVCNNFEEGVIPTSTVPPQDLSQPPVSETLAVCSGATTMTKQEVIDIINQTMDNYPQLDADDREYILLLAKIESSYDPAAKNPNSSATGLYQMLDATAIAYGLTECEDRVDPVKSTEAMIQFYLNEQLRYYNEFQTSGTILGKVPPSNAHTQTYASLSKAQFMYGLIHHDGVGNARNGKDKGGVAYITRRT